MLQAALKAAKEAKGARGDDVQFTEEEGSESSSEEEEEEDLEDDTDKVVTTLQTRTIRALQNKEQLYISSNLLSVTSVFVTCNC